MQTRYFRKKILLTLTNSCEHIVITYALENDITPTQVNLLPWQV